MAGFRGRVLTGPAFRNPRVKTALRARDRFALAMVREDNGKEPCQATVRRVIDAGLTALGWSEEERTKAYQEYVVEGLRSNLVNEFEGR